MLLFGSIHMKSRGSHSRVRVFLIRVPFLFIRVVFRFENSRELTRSRKFESPWTNRTVEATICMALALESEKISRLVWKAQIRFRTSKWENDYKKCIIKIYLTYYFNVHTSRKPVNHFNFKNTGISINPTNGITVLMTIKSKKIFS